MKRAKTRPPRLFLALLAAALLSLTTVAGCDSFLEKDPKGNLTENNFFQNGGDAVDATNATYNVLRDFRVHVFSWLGLTDIVSDDATKGSTPSDASFLSEIDNLNFDPGSLAFSDPWAGYFQGVYRANVALNNIPGIQMDEALQERLIGENKFLRAYYYFFLVRAYGGVPLLRKPLDSGDFQQPRAPADSVYGLIIEDLQDALEVLPSRDQIEAGRATRGAAQGLLAKVYLYRENYTDAQQLAEDVINSGSYALEPDYSFVFTQGGEFSSGSIFEVNAEALEAGGASTQYSQFQGVRGTPNLGFGFNQPSDDLEASYDPGDPRLQATILFPWEQVSAQSSAVVFINTNIPNQRYNEKAQIPIDNPGGSFNSGVNIRRLRYADVLLIAAEAAFQNGDEGQARTYLNMVRERARAGQGVTLGLIPERLDETIAAENLGNPTSSRVFVRRADENGAAAQAGVQGFTSSRVEQSTSIPLLVENMDIIESVGGTTVTTPGEYRDALGSLSPGQSVEIQVLRVTQEQTTDTTASTSTETLQFDVETQALLPDVNASGQSLLEAIWRERRAELAMEQHRWFDIVRQGRAEELMEDLGLDFQDRNRLYPIPQGEVDIAGLEQNPGY